MVTLILFMDEGKKTKINFNFLKFIFLVTPSQYEAFTCRRLYKLCSVLTLQGLYFLKEEISSHRWTFNFVSVWHPLRHSFHINSVSFIVSNNFIRYHDQSIKGQSNQIFNSLHRRWKDTILKKRQGCTYKFIIPDFNFCKINILHWPISTNWAFIISNPK